MNIEVSIHTKYLTVEKSKERFLINVWRPVKDGKTLWFNFPNKSK